uniref:hypothetical protein n=1 Tax=Thaumasiovibrio occultus TaxID=1891184 RepID=UPI000B356988|nr:hypothetical protein [Thaumasiovibrio occultus]
MTPWRKNIPWLITLALLNPIGLSLLFSDNNAILGTVIYDTPEPMIWTGLDTLKFYLATVIYFLLILLGINKLSQDTYTFLRAILHYISATLLAGLLPMLLVIFIPLAQYFSAN